MRYTLDSEFQENVGKWIWFIDDEHLLNGYYWRGGTRFDLPLCYYDTRREAVKEARDYGYGKLVGFYVGQIALTKRGHNRLIKVKRIDLP